MKKATKADAERQRIERIIVAVLKASREDRDVSRAELAERLGWKTAQVSELEIGRRVIRASDLFLIAKALKLDPRKMFDRLLSW